MNPNIDNWWGLHLRRARGESLSQEEQRYYDSELARQDQEAAPLNTDLESLKKIRAQLVELGKVNEILHSRWAALNQEIRVVEQALTPQSRAALGVQD